MNKTNHSKYWSHLLTIFEEHFEKGEKCQCGRKLPCRSKAIVMLAKIELLLRNDEKEKIIIISVPTIENWRKVVQKLLDEECEWIATECKRDIHEDYFRQGVGIGRKGDYIVYAEIEYWKQNYQNIKIITAEEFLGKENKPWKSIPDFTKIEKPKTTNSNHGKIVEYDKMLDILG